MPVTTASFQFYLISGETITLKQSCLTQIAKLKQIKTLCPLGTTKLLRSMSNNLIVPFFVSYQLLRKSK